jgi:NAD(P)-dependent dehydrogenase (short-subunit alcohol dehydrogenase family)
MQAQTQGRLAGKVRDRHRRGSGFGEGIARRYAEEGAAVVVNDIAEAGARRVAREIGEAGGKATVVIADVSRDADVKRLVDAALEACGAWTSSSTTPGPRTATGRSSRWVRRSSTASSRST